MNSVSQISILLMTVIVGYLFSYPMYNDMKVLQDEKSAREASLETINQIEEKKQQLAAQFSALSDKNKQDIDTILPDSFDFVRLTADVEAIGKKYGIVIQRVSEQEISASNGQTIGDSANQKGFHSGLIGFNFTTSYESFLSFMEELEKSLRILDIRSLNITPKQNNTYEYTVEFETYWL